MIELLYISKPPSHTCAYLYSAAYFKDGSLEQSTSSPLRARLTGQYWEYSPSRAWNSEGVMHSPAMEAAWPEEWKDNERNEFQV